MSQDLKPKTGRQARADNTRKMVVAFAARAFQELPYEDVTIRDLALMGGFSTGSIFAHFPNKAALYAYAMGFPHPWRPIQAAPKDGRLLLLLVDYSEEANAAAIEAEPNYIWEGRPLEDERVGRTIGGNNLDNDGEDVWRFSGWCWSHDHYTEGRGTPVAFIELDAVAPAVAP